MHGELLKAQCVSCNGVFECRSDINRTTDCAFCGADGCVRPQVVWFGEMPLHLDRIFEAVGQSDAFVAVGTSGQVHPAASLVTEAARSGALTVELNLEASAGAAFFDEHAYGPATEIVPDFVDRLLGTGQGGRRVRHS